MLVCWLIFQAGHNWLIEAMPWRFFGLGSCATVHNIFAEEPVNNYAHVSVVASELRWQMELFAVLSRGQANYSYNITSF